MRRILFVTLILFWAAQAVSSQSHLNRDLPNGNDQVNEEAGIAPLGSEEVVVQGTVSAGGTPLIDLTVVFLDEMDDVKGVVFTDSLGNYQFVPHSRTTYTVVASPPPGFDGDEVARAIRPTGSLLNYDIQFQKLNPGSVPGTKGDPLRSTWWWKIYLADVQYDGPRLDFFTQADVDNWGQFIYDTYFAADDATAIRVSDVTYVGSPPSAMQFRDVVYTMLDSDQETLESSTKRHLLANMLNLAAGYMSEHRIVTEDNVTAIQAIRQFVGWFHSGDRDRMLWAHHYLRDITLGKILPAGLIDVIPTGLTVSPESLQFDEVGETGQLTVTGLYSDGTSQDITLGSSGTSYSTDDPDVASVGPDGLVSATGGGTTLIIATNGVFSDTAEVTVSLPVNLVGVSVTPETVEFSSLGER
ncbi:hypothetical protein GF356_07505, partial [candidate division GN15 bacterium]|nr:hypothetical protein [candidate division GN15 bacterium]